jgi:Cyclic nucleotide-binding domain
MAVNVTGWLTDEQLELLRAHGEERTAEVGDVLYRVGDRTYPFIAILAGEAAILDPQGDEIVRHGPHGFLGELNLFSGQTVYVTAVVMQRMRYIAVDRDELRRLLFDDDQLSDVVTSAFVRRRDALQQRDGLGVEILGPRSSDATRSMVEFVRRNRLPHAWRDTDEPEYAALVDGLPSDRLPLVVLPGGARLEAPSRAMCCARWASAASSRRARRSTCSSSAPAPEGSVPRSTAPRRGWTRSCSRARRSAARPERRGGSRTTSASRAASAARS